MGNLQASQHTHNGHVRRRGEGKLGRTNILKIVINKCTHSMTFHQKSWMDSIFKVLREIDS